MNLPFFYPEHPEFKKHVEYVAGELIDFGFMSCQQPKGKQKQIAESRAKDIVLQVSSHPVRFQWLHDLIDTWKGQESNAMFEQGLEKYLREAIEYVIGEDWSIAHQDQESNYPGYNDDASAINGQKAKQRQRMNEVLGLEPGNPEDVVSE